MENQFVLLIVFMSLYLGAISDTPIPVALVEKYRKPCQENYSTAEGGKWRITKISEAKLVYVVNPDHRLPYSNQTHIKTLIVKTMCTAEDPRDADDCLYDHTKVRPQKFKLAHDKSGNLRIFIDNMPDKN